MKGELAEWQRKEKPPLVTKKAELVSGLDNSTDVRGEWERGVWNNSYISGWVDDGATPVIVESR